MYRSDCLSNIFFFFVFDFSNGGGRSGAFIALDANLELLKKTGQIDVFEYGKTLINSRPHLIDSVEQYQFIYDALAEVFFVFCFAFAFVINLIFNVSLLLMLSLSIKLCLAIKIPL